MHLVEIFLPLTTNGGQPLSGELYETVGQQMIERFGGLTSYSRAPARGAISAPDRVVHDDIAVIEVMTEKLDKEWWAEYRAVLEKVFQQEEILIRATEIVKL